MDPITAFAALSKGKKIATVLGIAIAVMLAIIAIIHFIDNAFTAAEDAGAAKVTNENLQTTITRTKEANNAEENIRNDADAAYANCLRHSRTPENC